MHGLRSTTSDLVASRNLARLQIHASSQHVVDQQLVDQARQHVGALDEQADATEQGDQQLASLGRGLKPTARPTPRGARKPPRGPSGQDRAAPRTGAGKAPRTAGAAAAQRSKPGRSAVPGGIVTRRRVLAPPKAAQVLGRAQATVATRAAAAAARTQAAIAAAFRAAIATVVGTAGSTPVLAIVGGTIATVMVVIVTITAILPATQEDESDAVTAGGDPAPGLVDLDPDGDATLPSLAPITSDYGWRGDPATSASKFHHGVDFSGGCGSPIYAAADGVVARIFQDGATYQNDGGAWIVEIDHGGGLSTWYVHMYASGIFVEQGDTVVAGQHIAEEGSSGYSTGCHLHFSVLVDGVMIDPWAWLSSYDIPHP